MLFIRFFIRICFILTCSVSAAFAGSAIWSDDISENIDQNSFDVAGIFFTEEESDTETSLPPWLAHAVAIPDVDENSPMIAIVIDDLGVNRKITKEVLSLPAPLTASFLYYADDLPDQTQTAKAAGHELLVHTPMEPINSEFNPGPGALLTEMSAEEIRDRLDLMLDSFPDYVGINNHMGSRFTANESVMRTVMEEVEKRGLLFLDSLTSGNSVAAKIAKQKNIPYAVRNVFLDNTQNEQEIMKQLFLLEKHARKHRIAVGIGHPHKATVNALKKWIPQAKQKGFFFVPISMIAVYLQDEKPPANVHVLNRHDEWE